MAPGPRDRASKLERPGPWRFGASIQFRELVSPRGGWFGRAQSAAARSTEVPMDLVYIGVGLGLFALFAVYTLLLRRV